MAKNMLGSWVFGMCQKSENGIIEARYFVIEKRDRPMLHGIIQNVIEIGTEIHSDEWLAYKTSETKEYIHKTVNHSQLWVDPTSGSPCTHTTHRKFIGRFKTSNCKKNAWYITNITLHVKENLHFYRYLHTKYT